MRSDELFHRFVAASAAHTASDHSLEASIRETVASILRWAYSRFVGDRPPLSKYLEERYIRGMEEHGGDYQHDAQWWRLQAIEELADAYWYLTMAELFRGEEHDGGDED